jgi:Holliday junction resolvase-like predicted endonuclease
MCAWNKSQRRARINAFGRVVCSQAYNEDGLRLIEESDPSICRWKMRSAHWFKRRQRRGSFRKRFDVIAVTSESVSEKKAAELQSISEAGANQH